MMGGWMDIVRGWEQGWAEACRAAPTLFVEDHRERVDCAVELLNAR